MLIAVLRRARVARLPSLHAALDATLRDVLVRFRSPLFSTSNTVCGELCLELLRQCNDGDDDATRQAACATLFFLFEQNFVAVGNVSRARLQTTVGATNLLAQRGTRIDALLLSLQELCDRAAKLPRSHHDGGRRKALTSELTELKTTIEEVRHC